MPTQLANNSKEYVIQLLRNAWNNVDTDMDYIFNEYPKIINLANDLGLTDLANEFKQFM